MYSLSRLSQDGSALFVPWTIALFHTVSRPRPPTTSAGMRFLTALVLLLQPADGLLLSAATRAPVARSAGLALSPLAVPRSSIIHMGRVCAP